MENQNAVREGLQLEPLLGIGALCRLFGKGRVAINRYRHRGIISPADYNIQDRPYWTESTIASDLAKLRAQPATINAESTQRSERLVRARRAKRVADAVALVEPASASAAA